MGILPNELAVFKKQKGLKTKRAGVYTRVEDTKDAKSRMESDWDEIICANVELVADALRQAGMIAMDSTLGLLGTQVDNVDVLFAELVATDNVVPDDPGTWKSAPLRLVLLEDKLIRNHQAKREVLAQIVDYAERAQREWTAAGLSAGARATNPWEGKGIVARATPWLERHHKQIDALLRQGDLLLVIAGDAIDDRLLRLARQFARHDDPLSLHELCLLSMALYDRGDEYLLVPHVVSAVERSEREVAIRVSVQAPNGTPAHASIERDTEAEEASAGRKARENPDVSEFLKRVKAALDGQLPDGFPEPTKKPKKNLEYILSSEQFGNARFKIHFGLWNPRSFSNISVGLLLETPDAETRDEWRLPLQKAAPGKDFKVNPEEGPRSIFVHKDLGWTEGEPLDDKLLKQVCSDFLRLVKALAGFFSGPDS